jgi:hypothetical protein
MYESLKTVWKHKKEKKEKGKKLMVTPRGAQI